MGRLGTASEVAEVVVFLLADSSSYVNGESIGVTGGTDFD
jgi:3-oxoacyl-[acyl-carrier protein] reductase